MTAKKREGRPPLDPTDPSVTVTFRIPSQEYDATVAHAKAARVELADYLRLAVRIAARRPPANDR